MIVTIATLRAIVALRFYECYSSFSDAFLINRVNILEKCLLMFFYQLLIPWEFISQDIFLTTYLSNFFSPCNKFDCVSVNGVLLEAEQKFVSDTIRETCQFYVVVSVLNEIIGHVSLQTLPINLQECEAILE